MVTTHTAVDRARYTHGDKISDEDLDGCVLDLHQTLERVQVLLKVHTYHSLESSQTTT